jgi:hypothetical protein
MRTSSQPASIMRMLWATVASVSIVSVVVMLCTRMGLLPPMPIGHVPKAAGVLRRRYRGTPGRGAWFSP